MLGFAAKGYRKACGTVSGGCDTLLFGDAEDFNFTETFNPVSGDSLGYSAIQRRTGATTAGGAYFYRIDSLINTINFKCTNANADGSSSSWSYEVACRMAQISQTLTNFNKALDASSVCGQPVFVVRMNSQKIFVMGEKYVNGEELIRFPFRQDGSEINSGTVMTDFNGQNLLLKGAYPRPPYEFTAGMTALSAFIAP